MRGPKLGSDTKIQEKVCFYSRPDTSFNLSAHFQHHRAESLPSCELLPMHRLTAIMPASRRAYAVCSSSSVGHACPFPSLYPMARVDLPHYPCNRPQNAVQRMPLSLPTPQCARPKHRTQLAKMSFDVVLDFTAGVPFQL